MPYAIQTVDKPGSAALRARVRDEHLKYLDAHLRAARGEYERLLAAPDHVEATLRKGAERARSLATPFLADIRRAVGIRSLG